MKADVEESKAVYENVAIGSNTWILLWSPLHSDSSRQLYTLVLNN